jgi:hypothetical protein
MTDEDRVRAWNSPRGREMAAETSPGGDSWYRQGGVEPVDFILSNNLPHWKGAVIAYVFRAGVKNKVVPAWTGDMLPTAKLGEIEDIEKAIWWLNKRLEQIRGAG